MDKVFQEEERKLAEIESKIDAIASRYERNAREKQAEIADFYCVDNDDRQTDEVEQLLISSEGEAHRSIGQFYSWSILDENTAVKACDKSFFDYNGSGVPREICWFFDSESMQRGDSKTLHLVFNGTQYDGKAAYESSVHSRMRLTWGSVLGTLLRQEKGTGDLRAVFRKLGKDSYRIIMLAADEAIPQFVPESEIPASREGANGSLSEQPLLSDATFEEETTSLSIESQPPSKEECALIAEFDSILEERFGSGHRLSTQQQGIVLSLYRGKSVAVNAPSGSMKSVMLYLIALKEHQTSGKQTLLTADAHLQENELVLADRLGLKAGVISTMDNFSVDFKKDKYDVIFVSYEFFKQHGNVGNFIDYFTNKIAYWGFDHPVSALPIWTQLINCCAALDATKYLMSKEGFTGLEISAFEYHEIQSNNEESNVKRLTLFSDEEKLNWLRNNLGELYGQGIVYCENEGTCKTISKQLRKNKIMAEPYVDVSSPEKRERINYLTNSFSNGGLPVLVTTHEVGKNLSNPRIRFIIHYDVPSDEQLRHLHVTQIGQLAENPVVYDLLIL